MKKIIGIIISLILLVVSINYTRVYASPNSSKGFADFDDKKAEQESQTQMEEQEKEIENSKDKSNNNYLESLSVENYELEPAFDKQTQEYTIKGKVKDSKITINAKASDSKAKISGNGKVELKGDSIRIDVTAESGTVRTYIIKCSDKEEDSDKETSENENQQNSNTIEDTTEIPEEQEDEIETISNIEEQSEPSNENNNIIWYIVGGIIILIIVLIIIFNKKNNVRKNGKHF